jgi:ketosteroid isomerase-like protein
VASGDPRSSRSANGGDERSEHVPSFFGALANATEVTEFTPLSFATNDDGDVMTVIRFGMTVPATGTSGSMELHHWFQFRDGKVRRYRGTEDTALVAELLNG